VNLLWASFGGGLDNLFIFRKLQESEAPSNDVALLRYSKTCRFTKSKKLTYGCFLEKRVIFAFEKKHITAPNNMAIYNLVTEKIIRNDIMPIKNYLLTG
jgi:hypothetical protein